MKKTFAALAAVGLMLSACAQTVYPEDVLAGDALTNRLTNTKLHLRVVSETKPRKGAATKFVVKMLPTGVSTWENNGKYRRVTLSNWEVRGNMLCLDDPNRKFYEERRRREGKKIYKREKNANCSPVAIQGDLITIHTPKSSYLNRALTGRIQDL
ncbi:hypothetical protein [Sulfitobacter donghicola]|uniref:Lipoprotein n=1 Tax=Sulfitobacter donghicola DSW-25 = KCTC 12864 = JCM 14565 TaxID=1300350 RepID=A0A073IF58_9RHOB|nr:hypothetical protein [Sulfitobacter donghicola]KEJ88116.1 hypothetical protein DSW25_17710 [Sulfitobacter donghicola DSW-25 = KCTC 12864 = JCM 14565]KIN68673.1 hypothetical protein Z948_2404 [Sulfitobacter donghicola DSW-25 = KCTC 12864 = JCM 14565]